MFKVLINGCILVKYVILNLIAEPWILREIKKKIKQLIKYKVKQKTHVQKPKLERKSNWWERWNKKECR